MVRKQRGSNIIRRKTKRKKIKSSIIINASPKRSIMKRNSRRGNINKKYLRRRKNWIQRNYKVLIAALLLIFVIAGVGYTGFWYIKNNDIKFPFFSSEQKSPEPAKKEDIPASPAQPDTKREIVWHDMEEPESKSVNYAAPEGTQLPYYIKVNRAANCVTVYGMDINNEYSIPVKAFACSCAKEGYETITGDFATYQKYEWGYEADGKVQYVTRINGAYVFSSVPYEDYNKAQLMEGQFNLLGQNASTGIIYLSVGDVKWIYDNCPVGTGVSIYDDASNPGPLGKPETIKIPEDSPYKGWDPTDPDTGNPWKENAAKISGTKDIHVKVGQTANLLEGVTALDTCGNDITKDIIVVGRYTFDAVGSYDIKYVVVDALASRAEVTVKLIVEE